jgi:hypothetical protein
MEVRLSPDEYVQVAALAAVDGISIAEWFRRLAHKAFRNKRRELKRLGVLS